MADQFLTYVENDTLPLLKVRLKDVNLTSYGAIELHIRYTPTALVKTAVVTDALNGEFQFHFTGKTEDVHGDLYPGRWEAEVQITDPDGEVITFTGLVFLVKKEIA